MSKNYAESLKTVKQVHDCSGQLSTSSTKVNAAHEEELISETQEVTRDCQFHSNEVEMAVHEWLQMQ